MRLSANTSRGAGRLCGGGRSLGAAPLQGARLAACNSVHSEGKG
jgi:predicted small secreted protein